MNSRNTNNKRIQGFAWVFTLNNYTKEDIEGIIDPIKSQKYDYIFQEEKGANETPHLQGYIKFKKKISFSTIKKLLPKAHIEKAKNKYACMNYCRKAKTRAGKIYKNFEPDEVIETQYESLEDQINRGWQRIRDETQREYEEGRVAPVNEPVIDQGLINVMDELMRGII